MPVGRAFLSLATVTLLCAVTSRAESPSIPAVAAERNGLPTWVAEDYALDSSGRLNPAFLGEHTARRMAKLAERNAAEVERQKTAATATHSEGSREAASECERLTTWRTDHFEPTGSIDDLAAHADVIVVGSVIAQRQGIYAGTPGTLILLKADYLKGSGTEITYLFYPYATIKTAHGTLCSRPLVEGEGPPKTGDRFIAFSMLPPQTGDNFTILAPDPRRELIHETQDGALYLPPAAESIEPTAPGFDEIWERISAAVTRIGEERDRSWKLRFL